MTLKTKVKVGNITNLSDARYCAGMAVDMLGFKINNLDKGGINPTKFKEITDWISGPEIVVENSEAPLDNLYELYKIRLVELPASEISNIKLDEQGHYLIISVDLKEWHTYREALRSKRDLILYLLVTNESKFDIAQVRTIVSEIAIDFPILLGFAIDINLIDEYLSWPITGLALNGSEETSPGIKDYGHLSSILEKLEID